MLWSKTLDSSVWRRGTKEERLLWMAMLMMKDSNGNIQSSLVGLADRARLTDEECRAALATFLAPDPDDTSGVMEGRKVEVIPGGWHIVNHDLYRFSTEAKREFWRQQKEDQREAKRRQEAGRKKKAKGGKTPAQVRAASESRERRFEDAAARGDQAECDRIAAEGLPNEAAANPED